MDPSDAIELTNAFIDPGLGGNGTTITFTRIIDVRTTPPTTVSASCPGFVRNYRPQEIIPGGSLMQGDSNIAIEGDSIPSLAQRLGTAPRATDKVSYAGFQRNVQGVDVLKISEQVVRINLLVRG
jgi:hypothetical protein